MGKYVISKENDFINKSLFGSAGRIGRLRFFVTLMVISFVYVIVTSCVGAMISASGDNAASGLILILWFVTLFPVIFCYIKRCRDAGISPHWTWITLIPFLGLALFLFLCFKPSVPRPVSINLDKPSSSASGINLEKSGPA